MTNLYALHAPSAYKLKQVVKLMRKLGAPRLHAHWRDGAWYALEGSHRIAAAHKLGLTPILVPVALHDTVNHDTADVTSKVVRAVLAFYDVRDWWRPYAFERLKSGGPE